MGIKSSRRVLFDAMESGSPVIHGKGEPIVTSIYLSGVGLYHESEGLSDASTDYIENDKLNRIELPAQGKSAFDELHSVFWGEPMSNIVHARFAGFLDRHGDKLKDMY